MMTNEFGIGARLRNEMKLKRKRNRKRKARASSRVDEASRPTFVHVGNASLSYKCALSSMEMI